VGDRAAWLLAAVSVALATESTASTASGAIQARARDQARRLVGPSGTGTGPEPSASGIQQDNAHIDEDTEFVEFSRTDQGEGVHTALG